MKASLLPSKELILCLSIVSTTNLNLILYKAPTWDICAQGKVSGYSVMAGAHQIDGILVMVMAFTTADHLMSYKRPVLLTRTGLCANLLDLSLIFVKQFTPFLLGSRENSVPRELCITFTLAMITIRLLLFKRNRIRSK